MSTLNSILSEENPPVSESYLDPLEFPFEYEAQEYWNEGFNVLPFLPREKRPACDWKEWETRRQTAAELKDLTGGRFNHCRTGIILGCPNARNVGDVEADSEEGRAFLESIGLPETATFLSTRPQGDHLKNAPHRIFELTFAGVPTKKNGDIELRGAKSASLFPTASGRVWLPKLGLDRIVRLPESHYHHILEYISLREKANTRTPLREKDNAYPPLLGKVPPLLGEPLSIDQVYVLMETLGIDNPPVLAPLNSEKGVLGTCNFCSVILGPKEREDQKPSATVIWTPGGRPLYRDWRYGKNFNFAEVFALQGYGCSCRKFQKIELALWNVRLHVKAGLLPKPSVRVPPLSRSAPIQCQRLLNRFVYLLACQQHLKHGLDTSTYARKFACAWAGIQDENECREGIEWLIRHHYLKIVGHAPSGYPHPSNVYKLGNGRQS